MHNQILNSKQSKEISALLESHYGFSRKLDYVFLLSNKEKVYLVNRDISRIDLNSIRINSMGVYFAELTQHNELRLSIEGSQIIGPHATKNVLEIDSNQLKLWFSGVDFEVESSLSGFIIIKSGNDFCGCGKIKDGKLLNFVSKVRRVSVI